MNDDDDDDDDDDGGGAPSSTCEKKNFFAIAPIISLSIRDLGRKTVTAKCVYVSVNQAS